MTAGRDPGVVGPGGVGPGGVGPGGVGPGGVGPDDGHLGDLLSALVDGELPPAQVEAAERHLAGCAQCRAERALTARSRELVAGLPVLALPLPVRHAMAALLRRRVRPVVWACAAAAAVGLTLMAVWPPRHHVTPQMAQLVAVHLGVASANTAAGPVGVPAAVAGPRAQPLQPATLAAPFTAPARLAQGYVRVGVLRRRSVVGVIYSDGEHSLSVFEQPGALDLAGLPRTGQLVMVGAARGESYLWAGDQVVTWQRGSETMTVVGDGPLNGILAAATSIPAPPRLSVAQRLRLTSRRLLVEMWRPA